MDEYVLIEYEIIDPETDRPKRKRIIATPSEKDPRVLTVYAMHRVRGFWTEKDLDEFGNEVQVEEDVFNELRKSLDKVMYKTMSVETIEFLKCDLTERLTYLFNTSTDPIFRNARVI